MPQLSAAERRRRIKKMKTKVCKSILQKIQRNFNKCRWWKDNDINHEQYHISHDIAERRRKSETQGDKDSEENENERIETRDTMQ